MKMQRQSGKGAVADELTSDQLEVVREGLCHASWQVRVAAFSVLCHHKKKAFPPPEAEMDLATEFVERNLTVDSAAFRQIFVSDFTILVVRCRECLATKV